MTTFLDKPTYYAMIRVASYEYYYAAAVVCFIGLVRYATSRGQNAPSLLRTRTRYQPNRTGCVVCFVLYVIYMGESDDDNVMPCFGITYVLYEWPFASGTRLVFIRVTRRHEGQNTPPPFLGYVPGVCWYMIAEAYGTVRCVVCCMSDDNNIFFYSQLFGRAYSHE